GAPPLRAPDAHVRPRRERLRDSLRASCELGGRTSARSSVTALTVTFKLVSRSEKERPRAPSDSRRRVSLSSSCRVSASAPACGCASATAPVSTTLRQLRGPSMATTGLPLASEPASVPLRELG